MIKMQGLSMSSLKKHPAVSNQLIPLYFCIGLGGIFATFYTIRLATCSPDVSWFNKKKAEPWNEYSNKQYKFLSPVRDYSKEKSPAPEY